MHHRSIVITFTIMHHPTYNAPKARELLSYVVGELGPAATPQRVVTTLFYVDLTNYRDTGSSVTGATYQAAAHGPDSRDLQSTMREMLNAGELAFAEGAP